MRVLGGSSEVIRLRAGRVQMGDLVVFHELDFVVPAGVMVVIRGANGSGKTTLLRCIAGTRHLGRGGRVGPSRCAYVPASWTAGGVTARRWLTTLPRGRAVTGVEPRLEQLGFLGDIDGDWRNLSFGNRRKLALAEAFASGVSLIVVDEFRSGLDKPGIAGLAQLAGEHLASGGAMVVAEQDTIPVRVPPGTPIVEFRINNGRLQREAASLEVVHQRATMTGTSHALSSYLDQAADFGVEVGLG